MSTLTPSQIQTIKSTAPLLRTHGHQITTSFYSTLLTAHPNLNSTFNRANQSNNHQATALATALYAYATHIDDLGALSPAVEKICHKHASLYIRPEQYAVVGEYLLRAMGEVLGEGMTEEVRGAWEAAYWQLARILIGREEELYASAEEWRDWRDFRIVGKERESSVITSFYLEPVDGETLPGFLPGQYISVRTHVERLGYAQPRQYSLSDAPNGRYYRISVKKEEGLDPEEPQNVKHPGYVSNILHDEREVGGVLQVSHPYGEFFLDPEKAQDKPVVLLSAGVGLTPMVSMVNTLAARGAEQPISFVHGSRSSATRAFHPHLTNLASRCDNMRYTTFVKEPGLVVDGESTECTFKDRLDLRKLDKSSDLFLDNNATQYFVCGPESFMTNVEVGLLDLGVERDRVHLEVFGTGMPVSA